MALQDLYVQLDAWTEEYERQEQAAAAAATGDDDAWTLVARKSVNLILHHSPSLKHLLAPSLQTFVLWQLA